MALSLATTTLFFATHSRLSCVVCDCVWNIHHLKITGQQRPSPRLLFDLLVVLHFTGSAFISLISLISATGLRSRPPHPQTTLSVMRHVRATTERLHKGAWWWSVHSSEHLPQHVNTQLMCGRGGNSSYKPRDHISSYKPRDGVSTYKPRDGITIYKPRDCIRSSIACVHIVGMCDCVKERGSPQNVC